MCVFRAVLCRSEERERERRYIIGRGFNERVIEFLTLNGKAERERESKRSGSSRWTLVNKSMERAARLYGFCIIYIRSESRCATLLLQGRIIGIIV